MMNYTNFKIVYTDDNSDDGTVKILRRYVKEQYPYLSPKLVIMKQKGKSQNGLSEIGNFFNKISIFWIHQLN